MGLVLSWVCTTRKRKKLRQGLLAGGTCLEIASAQHPKTAGFVSNLRNLCYASLDHNFVLNLKDFNCLFNKTTLNYECLLKQEAATSRQLDGVLRSTGLFIFLTASEFLTQSGCLQDPGT